MISASILFLSYIPVRFEKETTILYTNIGLAYLREGKLDEAIRSFQDAIRVNPLYLSAYFELGRAYAEKGRAHGHRTP